MSISDISYILDGIDGLSDDSRDIKKNFAFLLKDTKDNKYSSYITTAINSGAKVIFYEDTLPSNINKTNSDILFIPLDSFSKQSADIINYFYKEPSKKMNIYAVTGTNGKTAIVNFICEIFRNLGIKSGIIGTIGAGTYPVVKETGYTTPTYVYINKLLSDFRKDNVRNIAIEVSSHALKQERVRGLNISTAIFTNITHDHLDYHNSMEQYYGEKSKLFREYNVKNAIINMDNEYSNRINDVIDKKTNKVLVSQKTKSVDVYISNIIFGDKGLSFNFESPWGSEQIKTSLYGKFNVENLSLAISALCQNGFNLQDISKCISSLNPISGRMTKYEITEDLIAFVDYAHTPDAIENVLGSLKLHFPEKKITTIFGCGGERDIGKRKIMGDIANKMSDKIVLTNDNPRNEDEDKIINDIRLGISEKKDLQIIKDRSTAIKETISKASKDDLVIILGKGHEKVQILRDKKITYSDMETMEQVIKNL